MRGIAALLTEHGVPTTAKEDLDEPPASESPSDTAAVESTHR
jgi:hypothetical protein